MTSGQFTAHPIEQIFVNREVRQRRELRGIQELAWSIESLGQLHPIIIKRTGELVTGERRFEAIKQLGHTHILVQFTDELDPVQLQLIELEENVRRENLSWQDHVSAVTNYHKLRTELDPTWEQAKTAKALNMAPSAVSSMLDVGRAIEVGTTAVVEAQQFSVARGLVERAKKRRLADLSEQVTSVFTQAAPVEKVAPLLCADFNQWAYTYSGPRFNFIHCDFPYGVNADKHAQGAAAAFEGYEDTFDTYTTLLRTLAASMENVVAPSAHLMFWFSMLHYQTTYDALTAMGWTVNKVPLVWFKSDNTGILPDPSRGPRQIYETAFMAARGDRPIVRAVGNVVAHPVTKRIHMSEKPIGMLRKFMEMFVDDSTRFLDPTAGSANAVRAADLNGAASVLGLELSEEFFNRAKGAYYDEI